MRILFPLCEVEGTEVSHHDTECDPASSHLDGGADGETDELHITSTKGKMKRNHHCGDGVAAVIEEFSQRRRSARLSGLLTVECI